MIKVSLLETRLKGEGRSCASYRVAIWGKELMVNKYIPQGGVKHSEVDVEMYVRSAHITKRVKKASVIETQYKQVM